MPATDAQLRLHAIAARSRANGPGLRTAIWFQGCTLACPGCCNPATHAEAGGFVRDVRELADTVCTTPGIEGVTITGGEPLQQPRGLLALLETLRASTGLSVLVFSGYTRAQIEAQPLGSRILALTDVLVDGRYDAGRPLQRCLRASENQRIWLLSNRYSEKNIADVPVSEVLVRPDGSVVMTGIAPPGPLDGKG